jgi:low affinity Fe/Cu permease
MSEKIVKPSQVSDHVSWFDRLAEKTAEVVGRAPFFVFCIAIIIAWLIEGVFFTIKTGHLDYFLNDKFQLQVNSLTTIITFLMVALLQNSQARSNAALQHKLNAISDGLANLMDYMTSENEDKAEDLVKDTEELRKAVGIEFKESA